MFSTMLLSAQDTKLTQPYEQLIISELRLDIQDAAYMEVTNVGDSVLNLSDFWFLNMRFANPPRQPDIILDAENKIDTIRWPNMLDEPTYVSRGPDSLLNPGESFVLSMVFDRGWNGPDFTDVRHNLCVFEKSDWYIHQADGPHEEDIQRTFYPEYEVYDFDSITPNRDLLWVGYNSTMALMHVYYDTEGNVKDSVTVDVANLVLDENNEKLPETVPVAGVEDAVRTHILVRKSDVTEGNLDWNDSRGISPDDSEWITIPNFGLDNMCYNTIGNHDNYTLSPTSDVLDFDMGNGVITVPWSTQKGDSIITDMESIEGVAWQYDENPADFGEEHTIAQDGDTLVLYACGDEVEMMEFDIQVEAPATDMAEVFPRRFLSEITDEGVPVFGGTPYYVTEGDPDIDTIGDVPFAARVDTLYKYLEKAPDATWEIDFVDGEERVDLKAGDILKVTAEDNSTVKEYYIDVQGYEASDNANLGAITWPDRPDFLDPLVWNASDTIPSFDSNTLLYRIKLPMNTTQVPALVAHKVDANATVKVEPADNITGNLEQRTTNFTVTSESDTITRTYQVIFEKDLPADLVQPFESEPIISELLGRQRWNAALELANPGTEPIDMSKYMILISKVNGITPAQAIQNAIPTLEADPYEDRYREERPYIPGYKWPATEALYDANPGILEFDPSVDPILEPKDVFVIGNADHRDGKEEPWCYDESDVMLDARLNPWGETNMFKRSMINFPSGVQNIFIFKITNDSIRTGEKVIGDPADFELVEFWGTTNTEGLYNIGGRTYDNTSRISFRRKSHFVTPGTEYERGWAGTEETSDWWANQIGDEFQGINLNWGGISFNVGSHTMDPTSVYKSTVSSVLYMVDDGYEGELFIEGVSWGETVEQFYANLIQPDTGQTLEVLSNVDGMPKAIDDAIAADDTLKVISADSVNVTKYVISTTPLDDDAVLTTVDGSDVTIDIDGNTGVISGFGYDMTLAALLDEIEQPPLASLYIKDSDGGLVPTKVLNNDTVFVDATVSDDYHFTVIAQNTVDSIVYELQPSLGDNMAYVTSDLYEVDQDLFIISLIGQGVTVPAFLDNLIIPEGVTVTVYDKAGFERAEGTVAFDDYLLVESEDGTQEVTYYLHFLQEETGNLAYVLSDVKTVNEEARMIMGVEEGTTVSELLAILIPAPEAVVSVVDADGNEVASGEILDGYQVKVVSGNGELTVFYDIEILVSTADHTMAEMSVYPNPVRSMLYVENLTMNSQVTVKNVLGQTLVSMPSAEAHSGINVSQLSDGIYLLVVEKGDQVTSITKFVKSR